MSWHKKFTTLFLMALIASNIAKASPFDQSAGETYVGENRNDVPHGQGVMTWTDGRSYKGEWKNGERDGIGTYRWPGGETYKGQWRDGKWHGQGVYTKADGTTMSGIWKNGNMWNIKAVYPDGTKGQWKNGFAQ